MCAWGSIGRPADDFSDFANTLGISIDPRFPFKEELLDELYSTNWGVVIKSVSSPVLTPARIYQYIRRWHPDWASWSA